MIYSRLPPAPPEDLDASYYVLHSIVQLYREIEANMIGDPNAIKLSFSIVNAEVRIFAEVGGFADVRTVSIDELEKELITP